MAEKVGFEGRLYVDAAGVGQGTWVEVDHVGDIDPTDEVITAEVNDRRAGTVQELAGRDRVSHEFNLTHDPGDPGYEALKTARYQKTIIGLAVMNEEIATTGAEGWQYDAIVTQFPRAEELDGVMVHRVRVVPAGRSAQPPTYVEIV